MSSRECFLELVEITNPGSAVSGACVAAIINVFIDSSTSVSTDVINDEVGPCKVFLMEREREREAGDDDVSGF